MSEAIWQALAEKALGGRSLETLAGTTADGLRIAPLYARQQLETGPALRQEPGPWAIGQRLDHPDAGEANRLALLDLEGGANALTLVFAGEARGFGLEPDESALATALGDIALDLIGIRLDAGAATLRAATALAAITKARRLDSAGLAVEIGFDPMGVFARSGFATAADGDLPKLLGLCRAAGFAGRVMLADARPYHEAGAGEAQELAAVLATGVAYLRHLTQAGLNLRDASDAIAFLLVADADTFLTLAKFRALRRLWARVEEVCGLVPKPTRIHAETAWRMMSRRDPWVNVMRTTAAVVAAGLGGADVVTPLPFTLPLGLPEDGARRLARNTQLVLLDEAHLAAVDDPAAGSGGLESMTAELSSRAWALFQAIEREGGIAASLRDGAIQARIADTAARRAARIATLAHGLTGTSTFPVLEETVVALAAAERSPAAALGSLALPSIRDTAPFERLRDRADAVTETTGQKPLVFLATLGEPAVYGPRATYAANFFAAGGIATVVGAAEDYEAASMPVVCLCSSDALYAARLADAGPALRAAGARHVLLAGPRPPDGVETMIDGFIQNGCNALEVLEQSQEFLFGFGAAST